MFPPCKLAPLSPALRNLPIPNPQAIAVETLASETPERTNANLFFVIDLTPSKYGFLYFFQHNVISDSEVKLTSILPGRLRIVEIFIQ
jgi:hypothetical protein